MNTCTGLHLVQPVLCQQFPDHCVVDVEDDGHDVRYGGPQVGAVVTALPRQKLHNWEGWHIHTNIDVNL